MPRSAGVEELSRPDLPRDTFAGRARELEVVVSRLRRGDRVVLVGPPGAGKSRLALEVARVWPSTGPVLRCADPGALDAAASPPALLLLDPLAPAEVTRALALPREVPVLIVASEDVDLPELSPSDAPSDAGGAPAWRLTLAALPRSGPLARGLLVDRAPEPARAPIAEAPGEVERILELLEGLPGEIEDAAALLRVLTPRELLTLLEQRLIPDLATAERDPRAAPPADRWERTFAALLAPEREIVERWCTLATPFELSVAAALAADLSDRTGVVALLAKLARRFVLTVERVPSGGSSPGAEAPGPGPAAGLAGQGTSPTRYVLLAPLRAAGLRRLARRGAQGRARRILLDHLGELARRALLGAPRAGGELDLTQLELAVAVILAGTLPFGSPRRPSGGQIQTRLAPASLALPEPDGSSALELERELALITRTLELLPTGGARAFSLRGAMDRALARAQALELASEPVIAARITRYQLDADGDPEGALLDARAALAAAAMLGPRVEGQALVALTFRPGDLAPRWSPHPFAPTLDAALWSASRGVALLEAGRDPARLARATLLLAGLELQARNGVAARHRAISVLQLAPRAEDPELSAWSLRNLALLDAYEGRFDLAADSLARVEREHPRSGAAPGARAMLAQLALLDPALGDPASLSATALEGAGEAGGRASARERAFVLSVRASALEAAKERGEARSFHLRALASARALGRPASVFLGRLAACEAELGDHALAALHVAEARQLASMPGEDPSAVHWEDEALLLFSFVERAGAIDRLAREGGGAPRLPRPRSLQREPPLSPGARLALGRLEVQAVEIVVAPDGSLVVAPIPGSTPEEVTWRRTTFGARSPTARILAALASPADRQGAAAGLDHEHLVAIGWPGERIAYEAARTRLYQVVAALRRAGISVTTARERYVVDPTVNLRVCAELRRLG